MVAESPHRLTKHDHAHRVSGVLKLILVMTLVRSTVVADSSWVTVNDLIDAITGERSFTPTQLQEMDLNRDGSVDVADVVCLQTNCHKEIDFATGDQTVGEGAGTVNVDLELEQPVVGQVSYAVTGTATSGADFVGPTGSVTVNGTHAVIPIQIVNDAETREAIESIVLRLLPGPGYQIGSRNMSSIFIVDNDDAYIGTLRTREGQVGLSLEMVSTNLGFTGRVTSDGLGTLPIPPPPTVGWTATVQFGESRFEAQVEPIGMNAAATSSGFEFTRTFSLVADETIHPGVDVVDPERLFGAFTEEVHFTGHEYLNRSSTGRFVLLKAPPRPSTVEPVLQNSP